MGKVEVNCLNQIVPNCLLKSEAEINKKIVIENELAKKEKKANGKELRR